MPRLRAALLNLLTVLASLAITLLALEGALRFLPVARAPAVEPPTAGNPIQRYVANQPFTWSAGWNFQSIVHGRSNAQGFLADGDYHDGDTTPLIAVVGDSFVEALRVPFAKSITGRLAAALGARGRAYAVAQSGSPLSQYVAYAAHACAAYRPQRLVVVVVGNDFDESVYAHRQRDGIHHLHPRADGGFDLRLTPPAPPGLAERLARHSALALYLVRNLDLPRLLHNGGVSAAQEANDPYVGHTRSLATEERVAEGTAVIAWFLEALPKAACLAPREIVVVVDAVLPRLSDASEEAAGTSYFDRMRSTLIAEAAARGFGVIDMAPVFAKADAADQRPFDLPSDGHWNSHAHEVAAAAVREALADWPPLAGTTP